MKRSYKKLIEWEDFYTDMKKRHPLLTDMWNDLLELVEKYKRKMFSCD